MRMRKKKNGESRLAACSDFIFKNDGEPLSDPASAIGLAGAPVFLEIGAGKGGFACQMASKNKNAAYFAMERVTDCVIATLEPMQAEHKRLMADKAYLQGVLDENAAIANKLAMKTLRKVQRKVGFADRGR